MKRMVLLFLLLLGAFLSCWMYKINTPVNRPDEYADGYDPDAGAWWNTGSVKVDDDWKLDPEIPLNYIPVPGENELYMVIDNDGKIIGYRQREQQIDGSWLWKDVNPDIPDNYEPVEGLENVYKVTSEDGTVSYYKYIRNDDDTFAFVEVDENGNPIGKDRDATTIDGRHVHITGNIYSYLDEHGVVIGYDRRVSKGDGTYEWAEATLPQLPDLSAAASQMQLPAMQGLPSSSRDTSALDAMADKMAAANAAAGSGGTDVYDIDINITNPSAQQPSQGNTADLTPSQPTVVDNGDGTHTETVTVREVKNVDGWKTTYETYVKKVYDDEGNLISTYSDGPYEVETHQDIVKETDPPQGDKSKKEATLQAEYARVCGSFTYNTELEKEVFGALNAQRVENGLNSLEMTETANMVAKLRAADMAAYDVSSGDLPTYGSLGSMIGEYSVQSVAPGENLWKSIPRTCDEIHTRLQAVESTRKTRMGEYVTQYGIGIAEKDGNYYICEVVL